MLSGEDTEVLKPVSEENQEDGNGVKSRVSTSEEDTNAIEGAQNDQGANEEDDGSVYEDEQDQDELSQNPPDADEEDAGEGKSSVQAENVAGIDGEAEGDISVMIDYSARHEAQYSEQRRKKKELLRQQLTDKARISPSYYTISPKENVVLHYVDNFNRQYKQLYPGRKELLLCPENEFGVKKFVCTTIRPTQLPYKELYDFRTCAAFVSDFVRYETLDPPHELPKSIMSPTYTLKIQSGNCFDMSILLASILRGVGYDAYVVSGYATRHLTLMDQTKKTMEQLGIAPKNLLGEMNKVKEIDFSERPATASLFSGVNKYKVKPPRQLQSSFLSKQKEKMEKARLAKEEADRNALAELKKSREAEEEDDELKGLRIHAWVLVLPGRREVAEAFFIETSTGKIYNTLDENFLGLESVFSSQNYWVNMQICFDGMKGVSFDLGDNAKWEFILLDNTTPGASSKPRSSKANRKKADGAPANNNAGGGNVSDEEEDDENNEIVDLPTSWVDRLSITREQFESKCPAGFKVTYYRDAKWETFAEYHRSDGMIIRVTYFENGDPQSVTEVQEIYQNRKDRLCERIRLPKEGKIKARFLPGRAPHSLKEHIIVNGQTKEMHFYSSARSDGLVKRLEEGRKVQEFFVDREDRLFYRSVTYDTDKDGNGEPVRGTMLKMTEKYNRSQDIPAHQDPYKKTYFLKEDRIRILYHLEDGQIIRSVREFRKPTADSKSHHIELLNDFSVNPFLKPPKKQHLYAQQLELLRNEQGCLQAVKASERELNDILQARQAEEKDISLSISVYDTLRNDTKLPLDEDGKDMSKPGEEEENKTVELDYLSPFLINHETPSNLSREEALTIKDACMKSLRERLIEKANIIQGRLDEATAEYQRRQFAYSRNADSMTVEETDEYIKFCNESLFRIHILEKRLAKHKESVPEKYVELDSKLKNDSRLRLAFAM